MPGLRAEDIGIRKRHSRDERLCRFFVSGIVLGHNMLIERIDRMFFSDKNGSNCVYFVPFHGILWA